MIRFNNLYKVKQRYLFILFALFLNTAFGQDNFFYSQYFQVGPTVNPAFTGIDNFLDVKINYRSQWSGFTDAPSTNYFGINGYLKKESQQTYREYSLRISDPTLLDSLSNVGKSSDEMIRHGIGGHIIYDRQGPFSQISGYFNYAIHIPIGNRLKLSLGVSASLTNNRIDVQKLHLRNPDDDEYFQQLIAQGGKNTYFDINPGLVLYNENFYLSYAAFRAMRLSISSDEVLNYDKAIDHNFLFGIKIKMGSKAKLLPSVYYNYNNEVNNHWEVNTTAMFNEKAWFGLSYRSTDALIFMAGIYINNRFNISYSYDYLLSNMNAYVNGSHEIHFGLMLNKKDLKAPYLW